MSRLQYAKLFAILNNMIQWYRVKILYYDWQVKPSKGETCDNNTDCTSDPYTLCSNKLCVIPVPRGLCSMLENNPDGTTNVNRCPLSGGDTSINCVPVASDKDCNGFIIIFDSN